MAYSKQLLAAIKTRTTAEGKHKDATVEFKRRDSQVQALLISEAKARKFKTATPKMSEALPDSEPPRDTQLLVLKRAEDNTLSWGVTTYIGSGIFAEPGVVMWALTPDFPAV
jgi:hypothetical protein